MPMLFSFVSLVSLFFFPSTASGEGEAKFSSADCTWKFVEQPLSHFSRGAAGASYQQRLCVYDKFWEPDQGLPVFFYTGNESPVEEYVNNTGLMWDLAPQHNALVIFAEHRYFGESVPALDGQLNCMAYLSSEEALGDYAALVNHLRREWGAEESAVIVFGGSYGGMLAAWMRIQYPHAVDGAIAASAPILGLPLDHCPMDSSAQVVTHAASPAAGASERCADNLKAAYVAISEVAKTAEGRRSLTEAMNLCTPLGSTPQSDSATLLAYLQTPLFDLAEGSYPFATDYITFALTGLAAPLPPWAMQEMCDPLGKDFGVRVEGSQKEVMFSVRGEASSGVVLQVDWDSTSAAKVYSNEELQASGVLALTGAVAQAIQVWYNVTGLEPSCIDWEGGAAPNAARASEKEKAGRAGGMRGRGKHTMPTVASATAVHRHQQQGETAAPVLGDTCSFSSSSTLDVATAWNALVCNEGVNLVNWWAQGTGRDLYWPPNRERNATLENQVPGSLDYCRFLRGLGLPGVPEQPDVWGFWLDTVYGGLRLESASNIVFSQGDLDPWMPAGVPLTSSVASPVLQLDNSVASVVVKQGGHHLDLFWPTEEDPRSVRDVRAAEGAHIEKWIAEAATKRRARVPGHA